MKLTVLYGSDDNYAPYTGISMTSLFENNRDLEDITVACSNEDEYDESPFVADDNIDITPEDKPGPEAEEAEEVASDDSF